MVRRRSPGAVRDVILKVMKGKGTMTTEDVLAGVRKVLGDDVPASSVRSYLRLGKSHFDHIARGKYRMKSSK